jgi:YceI-like domain
MSVRPLRSVSVNLGLAYLGPHVQTALDVVYQDSGALLVFKSIKLGVVALLLAACTAPGPRHATPQNPGESPAAPPLHGTVYRIDESRSELRILVYRAGPLAHLGHNHVMVNRSIHGVVNLADSVAETQFSMEVPAAAFVVDDAQARSEEGPDFAAAVPDDAKSGTLHNMLSTSLLDADEFPMITIKSIAIAGAGAPGTPRFDLQDAGAVTFTVAISVAGHESRLDVPFTLHRDSEHISAVGSLELRQTALGLTPYSLMLGALQVQDAIKIKFNIVANPG